MNPANIYDCGQNQCKIKIIKRVFDCGCMLRCVYVFVCVKNEQICSKISKIKEQAHQIQYYYGVQKLQKIKSTNNSNNNNNNTIIIIIVITMQNSWQQQKQKKRKENTIDMI